MPTTCSFMFDRPEAVYYSGEVLNGKVILTTDKVKEVRGVYITIKGAAKVRWTERKSRHNHHRNKREYYTVVYKGEQRYLHSATQAEGEMDLPPGVHEYTFTSPLPMQLPSSVSGEHGHVSYEVELKLDRPLRFDNVYTNCFTVLRPLNLNMDPSYTEPIVDEDQKYFCCCCCESGPMKSQLKTEFAGYAPGQKINFTVLIDNEANKDIFGCTVELIQKLSFQSDTPERKIKISENTIDAVSLEGANRFTKKLHKGSIQIPSLPPTTMGPSDIINVTYALKAEIESGLCSSNEELHANITIGTVPLVASATNPNSVITVQPTAPNFDFNGDSGDCPPNYGSIVPPSFEEATGMNKPFIDTEVDENRILDPYIPKYPVYHNFATPSAPGMNQTTFPTEPNQTVATAPNADLVTSQSSQSTILPYPVDLIGVMPTPETPAVPQNVPSPAGKGPVIGWRS